MNNNHELIEYFRDNIPTFECTPGCHDCCGPVTTSAEEMSRLPYKTDAQHDAALAEWNCVHLGPKGCKVYEQRPLICRVFGTTPNMPCPNSCRPTEMLDSKIEKQIHHFIANTRQVLV